MHDPEKRRPPLDQKHHLLYGAEEVRRLVDEFEAG
jgi:hypothetical protein